MIRQRFQPLLLSWLALGLKTLSESLETKNDVYSIPSFRLADLLAGRRSDDLATVLGTTGILAVTGNDDTELFGKARNAALNGLCECTSTSPSSTRFLALEHSDRAILSDGRTTRTTLATATLGEGKPLPLPIHELEEACGKDAAEGMDMLRDYVSVVSNAFVGSLDRLLEDAVTASSKMTSLEARERSPLLQSKHGVKFNTFSSIVKSSHNLEHFHVYENDVTRPREDEEFTLNRIKQENFADNGYGRATAEKQGHIDGALRPHTDAGLFLSFVPALPCSETKHGSAEDRSFYVRVNGEMRRALFPEGSIAIMLGAGAEHWLDVPRELLPLRATVHTVRMGEGEARAWYGMMHLVPQDAVIQREPLRTFADMRAAMVSSGHNKRRFGDVTQAEDITIGCGVSDHLSSNGTIDNNLEKPTTLTLKTRRRLQMVPDGSACNNSTNFYCWMSCLDIPDANHAPGYISEGYSLYCLDPATLASSRRVSTAVRICMNGKVPGGAMNSDCMGSWEPTVPGVPSQVVKTNSTKFKPDEEPYCYGGTSMYMQGFEWIGTTCVVYLFPQWVLSTQAAFVAACIGTLVASILLEAVIRSRRKICNSVTVGWKRLAMSTLLYGVQLTIGYFIMLVVMTYSGPLFLCVILGLMAGHAIFNAKSLMAGEVASVPEGSTPCCQNDLGSVPEESAVHSFRQANAKIDDAATAQEGVKVAIPCSTSKDEIDITHRTNETTVSILSRPGLSKEQGSCCSRMSDAREQYQDQMIA